MDMAFKVVFLAHTPDAEPEKHNCVIETSKYKLFTVLVKDQNQAVEVCKKLVKEEGIHSILLCPGFTHRDVAEISEAVGEKVAVAVARGDGPGSRISMEVIKKEEMKMSAKRKRDKVKKAVKRKPKLSIKEKRKLRREK
ncbi:MAG: hypothetical protein COX49_02210, partial [bacterium (Candidatus Stahlbacteria) CG23_combo_of_CG06-09_8_20_14_all_40_9]